MRSLLTHRRVLVVLSAFAAIIALVAYNQSSLILLSTHPHRQAKNADLFSPIELSFNHQIASANISESGSPNYFIITPEVPGDLRVSGRQIIFNPTVPLSNQTKYTITLRHVTDSGGRVHADINFSFTTGYVAWNKLPDATKQKYLDQTDEATSPLSKFLAELPATKPGFSLRYELSGDYYSATLTNSDVTAGKQAVTDFIKSFNVDPAKLTILYYSSSGALLN